MSYISAIFLGILQGITEFLPVSSSGHLVIVQNMIPGFSQPGVLFDVLLHFGTFLAVVIYFKKNIREYFKISYIYLLLIGTIPAVLVGLLFRSEIEVLFRSVKIVGFALIITGIFNLITDKIKTKKKEITITNSFIIGVFQAIAIVPGISRSGSTIFAAAVQKIDKKKAAEFSFILSLPAILGANLLEILSNFHETQQVRFLYLFAGFISAFLSGYFAIKIIFRVIQKQRFEYFAYYCIVLGLISIFVL